MLNFKLNNGNEMPCIGFGTYRMADGELCYQSVVSAIECGYRHIDTAAFYGNEQSIGNAIKDSGINRQQLFVTTKLWNTEHSYEKALKAFDNSLNNLGLEYLDLYLIHWPVPKGYKDCWEKANSETWKALEKLYNEGLIKAIGVSNFKAHHIETLNKTANIKPMVNQIELHPGFLQTETVEFCKDNEIIVQAWSPFAVGRVFELQQLNKIASKYNKTISQILMRWFFQKDIVPLPKSSDQSRMKENIDIFDFELISDDVTLIDKIKADIGSGHDSDNISF